MAPNEGKPEESSWLPEETVWISALSDWSPKKPKEVWVNQIEAARKTMARFTNNAGKIWIRIFTDMPITQKPAEVGMGKGKGDPVGFVLQSQVG